MVSDRFLSNIKFCDFKTFSIEKIFTMLAERCGNLPDISDSSIVEAAQKLENAFQNDIKSKDYIIDIAESLYRFIMPVARGNTYFKQAKIRIEAQNRMDPYVFIAVLQVIVEILCDNRNNQLAFLAAVAAVHEPLNFYSYLTMAYMELNAGNITNAERHAKTAYSLKTQEPILSDLFYKIKSVAVSQNMNSGLDVQTSDMSDYFCAEPFELLCVSRFDHSTQIPTFKICNCPAWLSVGSFTKKLNYNCGEFIAVRESILNGSFRYCNRIFCPKIYNKTLPKKAEITDPYLRDIINNHKVIIEKPRSMHFEYDRDCNLKCPQCRKDFIHYTEEQITSLNIMAQQNIIPYISSVNRLKLSGAGEALSSPHSLYLLKSLSREIAPVLEIAIMTNGAAVTRDKWNSLGEAADLIQNVNVSIDGTHEIYEECRYPAKWNNLCNSMDFFRDLKENKKIKEIKVSTVVQNKNFKTFNELYSYSIDWQVDKISFKRMRNVTGISPFEFIKTIDVVNENNPEHDIFIKEMHKLKNREIELQKTEKVTKISFNDFKIFTV